MLHLVIFLLQLLHFSLSVYTHQHQRRKRDLKQMLSHQISGLFFLLSFLEGTMGQASLTILVSAFMSLLSCWGQKRSGRPYECSGGIRVLPINMKVPWNQLSASENRTELCGRKQIGDKPHVTLHPGSQLFFLFVFLGVHET